MNRSASSLCAALVLTAQAAQAQDVFCPVREARSGSAWAIVVVRAEKTVEDSSAGRGDHCDVQAVEGRVVRVIKGPVTNGDALRFGLSQGACGAPDSVNDDFVQTGDERVLLLRQDAAGGVYQARSESPEVYAAKEKACGNRR